LVIPDGLWEKRFAGRVQSIKCKKCGQPVRIDGRNPDGHAQNRAHLTPPSTPLAKKDVPLSAPKDAVSAPKESESKASVPKDAAPKASAPEDPTPLTVKPPAALGKPEASVAKLSPLAAKPGGLRSKPKPVVTKAGARVRTAPGERTPASLMATTPSAPAAKAALPPVPKPPPSLPRAEAPSVPDGALPSLPVAPSAEASPSPQAVRVANQVVSAPEPLKLADPPVGAHEDEEEPTLARSSWASGLRPNAESPQLPAPGRDTATAVAQSGGAAAVSELPKGGRSLRIKVAVALAALVVGVLLAFALVPRMRSTAAGESPTKVRSTVALEAPAIGSAQAVRPDPASEGKTTGTNTAGSDTEPGPAHPGALAATGAGAADPGEAEHAAEDPGAVEPTADPSAADVPSPAPGYDTRELNARVRQMIRLASNCHKGGRARGTATLSVRVSPSGYVSEVSLVGEPIASAPVSGCILAYARALRLKPFDGPSIEISRELTLD
jgi:hypothetical protein